MKETISFIERLLFFWETVKMAWKYWAKESFFFFVITCPHEQESSPWSIYKKAYQATAIFHIANTNNLLLRRLVGDNWRREIKNTSLKLLMIQYPYLKSAAATRYSQMVSDLLKATE